MFGHVVFYSIACYRSGVPRKALNVMLATSQRPWWFCFSRAFVVFVGVSRPSAWCSGAPRGVGCPGVDGHGATRRREGVVRVCVRVRACHRSRLCSHHAYLTPRDRGRRRRRRRRRRQRPERRWCGERRGLAGKTSRELPHASV